MTPLTRPVTRRTAELHRGRPLVVQLEGRMIRVREFGRRHWHTLTITQAFYCAVRNTAAAIKAEKLAAKKARKAGR